MHKRLKQSITVQRQIPEHIRNSYPLFVEFLKSYYEFLDETQNKNLEEFRDIDTTLDQFIERFKSELSTNVPIELAEDKRMLLRHLREFYLSRGSEASFRFLFRTLFNKEATLFYPSTQMLRVSDGRWNQDTSIFVEMTSDTDSLFPLNGNFINIQYNGKTVETYVQSVIQYAGNIYEIFIDKNISKQIDINSEVIATIDGVLYEGIILKCPSKISVYKKGKGFKAGDIFSLKTSIGNGCTIKVTKVDSDGGILAIQVTRFALDYRSTFWSFLSNKDIEAIDYNHPLTLNWPGPGNPPAYNENHGGFTEYGFATKQSYMYYDTDIPVGVSEKSSDRYYVDGSYVGDIVSSFYQEQKEKVLDEDLAIIQVELGAVAKYPGYYLTQNGFISDEMYIQDGKYYQAFSYVIKVEEELRRYADLVKSILHPAGMKMYAEYNITNQLDLTASSSFSFKQLQFASALSAIEDGGYAYSEYTPEFDLQGNLIIPLTSTPGAIQVFAGTGRNSKVVIKKFLSDFLVELTSSKTLSKIQEENLLSPVSQTAKNYSKNHSEQIDQLSAITTKAFSKDLSETILNALTVVKQNDKSINDVTDLMLSLIQKQIEKSLSVDQVLVVDDDSVQFDKNISDLLLSQLSQITTKEYSKSLLENIFYTELNVNLLEKTINESVTQSETLELLRTKYFDDIVTLGDVIENVVNKAISDSLIISDAYSNGFVQDKQDVQDITSSGYLYLNAYNETAYFDASSNYMQSVGTITS